MAFTRSPVRSRLAPPNFPTDTSRNARLVASSRTVETTIDRRWNSLRPDSKCGRERSMTRRSLLCTLAGMAATPYASRRVGAGPFMNASVAVGCDQPGRAISEHFIGLSYESAILASPDYLSPDSRSVMGLLRGLGPGAVLRLGGNSSERTVWRDTGDRSKVGSFVVTPAAIDAVAVLLNALDWRLIYGLNLARGTPQTAAEEAAYVARAVGPRLLAFQIGNEPDGFGRWSGVRPQ